MASYKVPQDVEADDKLIGPFSFRQFVYLIIVALAIALAWGLAQIFIGLAIIPLPIILLFGALALPLRKDQPMEIYLAAIVSFYLKPNRRLWDPEGVESTIEITAPKTAEVRRTKDISEGEAVERLSYLANLVDTQGWSIRGVQTSQNIAMNTDVILEAQSVEDVLATNTPVANTLNQMMEESTRKMREEARQRMFQPTTPPPTVQQPVIQPVQPPQPQPNTIVTTPPAVPISTDYQLQATPTVTPTQQQPITAPITPPQNDTTDIQPVFNPYPTIKQSVLQPLDVDDQIDAPPVEDTSTSTTEPSTDIIELANNTDLSIQTIAHEANRLKKKSEEESDEVVISLR